MQLPFRILATITCVLVLIGCNGSDSTHTEDVEPAPADAAAHSHGEKGPHGGHLVEMDPYHLEVVSDHDTHKVAIHLLDGQVKELTEAVEATVVISVFDDGEFKDFTLPAGDEPGAYELEDKELCHILDHSKDVRARIKVSIDGKELVAKYEHEAHAEGEPHPDH